MTKPIAALLTLAGILSASEANAQHVLRRGHGHKAASHANLSPSSPGISSCYTTSSDSMRTPLNAGTQGTNAGNDFPFYGQPYGHPYDRWTWSTLSGSYGQGLARYYDPPVK